MEKLALEMSEGTPYVPSATLTKQEVPETRGTEIVSEPSFGVLSARVVQVDPEFVDSWMSTVLMLPVLSQVTVRLSPAIQVSPPFGAVTVIVLMATSNEIVLPRRPTLEIDRPPGDPSVRKLEGFVASLICVLV